MDVRFNQLSQQIFNKPLEECSELKIRSFIEQHPYFSPAQFLLLKKLDKNSKAYQAQYQKAILYYHDPVAFDFLVNAQEFYIDIDKEEARNKKQETKNIEQSYQDNIQEEKSNKPVLLNRIGGEQEAKTVPQQHEKDEQSYQDIIQQEKKEVEAFAKENAPPTEQLTFEPFHTVDYFASLGIKLSQEEIAKDRMGKQLKSFTEWLKTMKRLPVPELEKKMSGGNEQKVESMAAHSVESADVVTEAMAEVWIKQGNAAKAIEVYNKLSLQNPSKSSYFAAKIEHLKEQN